MSTMKNKQFFNRIREQSFGYDEDTTKSKNETKRRPNKNWTKFYEEHADDYDDLEDFHD